METRQIEPVAHVVSVNGSRVCKKDNGINIRNKIIIWIIKKMRTFYEAVQLISERNIVHSVEEACTDKKGTSRSAKVDLQLLCLCILSLPCLLFDTLTCTATERKVQYVTFLHQAFTLGQLQAIK